MKLCHWQPTYGSLYLLQSRFLTHAVFWLGYYILFSLLWAKPESGFFGSFFLEFVLMPVRIMAAYCMIYMLIPLFLETRKYRRFFTGFALLILSAGFLQMVFGHFFYERLLLDSQEGFELSLQSWLRNCVLINTTVLLLGTAKVFQMYIATNERLANLANQSSDIEFVTVKAERRTHRLRISDILYIEGMGNYVTYYQVQGEKKMVYSSLKDAQSHLPEHFLRTHRSYLVNKQHIDSFNHDEIFVAGKALPRGKDIDDQQLGN